MAAIPRDFHFVFGLREQRAPRHVIHWLCLESCRQVNAPPAMHVHCRHLPHGAWWERIAPFVTVHRIGAAPQGFDTSRYADSDEGRLIARAGWDYAHEADFLRLEILHAHGGVYADMDTLFVQRYHDRWHANECVLGEEAPAPGADGVLRPSLCNAVIMAAPESRFVARWLADARASFDGSWSNHSCRAAARLWTAPAGELTVLPRRAWYLNAASPAGIAALFTAGDTDTRGVHSLHLWAHLWWSEARTDISHFHAALVTPAWLRSADATYAVLARRFLPDDAG
jgi:hypothetical protein